jgi:hypothetical protein
VILTSLDYILHFSLVRTLLLGLLGSWFLQCRCSDEILISSLTQPKLILLQMYLKAELVFSEEIQAMPTQTLRLINGLFQGKLVVKGKVVSLF